MHFSHWDSAGNMVRGGLAGGSHALTGSIVPFDELAAGPAPPILPNQAFDFYLTQGRIFNFANGPEGCAAEIQSVFHI